MSSSFYLSSKIGYECSQMYEHQPINDYTHNYDKQVTMSFSKLFWILMEWKICRK